MNQRGRKSRAALSVVGAGPQPIEVVERPDPPEALTDEQALVWRAVVDSHPADWFTASALPILVQYCRHVVQARRVALLIEQAEADEDIDVDQYNKLLTMQDRESKAIAGTATKLRMTPQATANWRGNKKPGAVAKPWETQ